MALDNGPVREFDFEEWLRDGVAGMRRKLKRQKREFNTSEFRTHMRNARREQLLALRSLIDSGLEFIGVEEKKTQQEKEGETKAGGVL
jgi:hypothetical protein